jgi:ATP-dependent RNA helicase DDX41
MSMPTSQRRRTHNTEEYILEDDDADYEPYIPLAQRREAKLARLAQLSARADSNLSLHDEQASREEQEDVEREEERERDRLRREKTLLVEAQEVHSRRAAASTLIPSVDSPKTS